MTDRTTRKNALVLAAEAATSRLKALRRVAIAYARERRELEIRHARERAALTAWEIECHQVLREAGYE